MTRLTKEELISVLSEFVEKDLMCDTKDLALKAMASAVVKFLKISPELIDNVLDSSIVKTVICLDDDEKYNVDKAMTVIREVVSESGKIYITIPSVPLLYPEGKRLGLTSSDVDKLSMRLSAYNS